MDKNKLNVKEELEIRKLEKDQRDVIIEHYDKLSSNEIDNDKSKEFHNKLGFTVSEDRLYWIF